MQEHSRKFAPHPWDVSKDQVAPDCLWAWRNLVVCFPGWKMAGSLFGGTFSDLHVMGKVEVVGHGEGGLLAVEVARDRPDLFRSVVVLAAPARNLVSSLQSRLRDRLRAEGLEESAIEEQVEALRKELETLRDVPPDQDPGPGRRLLRDLLRIEPADSLQKLKLKPLLLYGAEDGLVPAGHRALLRSTLSLIRGYAFEHQTLRRADHEFLMVSGGEGAAPGRENHADVARLRHPALVPFIRSHLIEALGRPAEETR
jgi:hypothetical protein